MQEPAENDTSEARDTHVEEVESDDESSLFIPQTFIPGTPIAASSDTSIEAFEEEQKKHSVFSESSEGPSSTLPTTVNVPTQPTSHAAKPAPPKPWKFRNYAMRPMLGQTYYDALKTDFEHVAETYRAMGSERGILEKSRKIAALQSSVDELTSDVEVLSEENLQLKARIRELEQQAKKGKTK